MLKMKPLFVKDKILNKFLYIMISKSCVIYLLFAIIKNTKKLINDKLKKKSLIYHNQSFSKP